MPDTNVAEAAAPANEDTRSKRQKWRDETTVALTEKGAANPKKPNSMSFDRYQVLLAQTKKGATPTVSALFKAGYRMDDVRHDTAHGFITLNQPFEL